LEVNDYTHLVGSIITNLQALETVLRYHSLGPKAREVQFPTVGALSVVENDLTSWVSLGKLVKRFNSSLKPDEQTFKVDSQVVIIRDAFAHGRLVTSKEKLPFTLWKFGQPENGRVPDDVAAGHLVGAPKRGEAASLGATKLIKHLAADLIDGVEIGEHLCVKHDRTGIFREGMLNPRPETA
jgi:hypothetical protein